LNYKVQITFSLLIRNNLYFKSKVENILYFVIQILIKIDSILYCKYFNNVFCLALPAYIHFFYISAMLQMKLKDIAPTSLKDFTNVSVIFQKRFMLIEAILTLSQCRDFSEILRNVTMIFQYFNVVCMFVNITEILLCY